jgi:FkbM family methyltransferase
MILTINDLEYEKAQILSIIKEDLFKDNTCIAIYGVGFLGQWSVQWLRNKGINITVAFDSDLSNIGNAIHGVTVYKQEDITKICPDFVFITARHAVEPIKVQLDQENIPCCSLEAYCTADSFSKYLYIYNELLSDEVSKKTLIAVLMSKLTGKKKYCEDVYESNQYFSLPKFCGAEKDIYVDAGAYVGDSIERFLWATNGFFSKIYGFEPAARQYNALKNRVARIVNEWALDEEKDIVLINAALSDKTGIINSFIENEQLQSVSLTAAGTTEVQTYSLDEFIDGKRVSFIKADVEGMEMDLLKGAVQTIMTWRPKLAICVYHYPNDLQEIVDYLHDLMPEYEFKLRHHSPQMMETVLYCWVD